MKSGDDGPRCRTGQTRRDASAPGKPPGPTKPAPPARSTRPAPTGRPLRWCALLCLREQMIEKDRHFESEVRTRLWWLKPGSRTGRTSEDRLPAMIRCRRCHDDQAVKYGHIHNGKQRFRCQGCGRQFVPDPTAKFRAAPAPTAGEKGGAGDCAVRRDVTTCRQKVEQSLGLAGKERGHRQADPAAIPPPHHLAVGKRSGLVNDWEWFNNTSRQRLRRMTRTPLWFARQITSAASVSSSRNTTGHCDELIRTTQAGSATNRGLIIIISRSSRITPPRFRRGRRWGRHRDFRRRGRHSGCPA